MEDSSEAQVKAQGFWWLDRGQECRQAFRLTTKPTLLPVEFGSPQVFPNADLGSVSRVRGSPLVSFALLQRVLKCRSLLFSAAAPDESLPCGLTSAAQ